MPKDVLARDLADFWVYVYDDRPGSQLWQHRGNGYWALKKGTLKPYARATVEIHGKKYRVLFFPRNEASYPAPKIIEREVMRHSVIRAQDEGWIEEFGSLEDETGVPQAPRKVKGEK